MVKFKAPGTRLGTKEGDEVLEPLGCVPEQAGVGALEGGGVEEVGPSDAGEVVETLEAPQVVPAPALEMPTQALVFLPPCRESLAHLLRHVHIVLMDLDLLRRKAAYPPSPRDSPASHTPALPLPSTNHAACQRPLLRDLISLAVGVVTDSVHTAARAGPTLLRTLHTPAVAAASSRAASLLGLHIRADASAMATVKSSASDSLIGAQRKALGGPVLPSTSRQRPRAMRLPA